MGLSQDVNNKLLAFQKNEITEHHIYSGLAKFVTAGDNRRILQEIAADELRHYHEWKKITGQEMKPDRRKVWFYLWVGKLLGITFGVKLMERGEQQAGQAYAGLAGQIPGVEAIIRDENEHEDALLAMLDEERLRYAGSVVLGLNDALVELTGALAGLTLALQDTRLIALSGSITGIAASLSMAASEYLSTRSEETARDPLRASIYTGVAYIFTVLVLILPYLLLENYFVCLALSLIAAVVIIAAFNYYISVAKDQPFLRRFWEMAGISLGVAALSFVMGYLIRITLGIEV